MKISENIPLKAYNTFGINVTGDFFVPVTSVHNLKELMSVDLYKKCKRLILGGGSNILFTQNFDGLIIKNEIKGIARVNEDEHHVYIKAGAGEVWHEFVLYCIENNLAGLENLSLIPGTVGAAPMQNIGAYGVEVKDVFENLEALHVDTGEIRAFNKDDCKFGYRESVFKNIYKEAYVIVAVTFKLNKIPVYNVSYGAIKDTLEKNGIKDLSIKAISDAVIEIRRSKLPDPKQIGNAGSFFKNPEVSIETLHRLQKDYPVIPNYPLTSNTVKLAAGWLIEQCGWKGKRIGNTGSHKDQALVLVNYGEAKGDEIWSLAMDIKSAVLEKFGVEISPEVNIV